MPPYACFAMLITHPVSLQVHLSLGKTLPVVYRHRALRSDNSNKTKAALKGSSNCAQGVTSNRGCGHAEIGPCSAVYQQHDAQLHLVDGAKVRGLRHAEPCCNGVSNTSANEIQILDDSTEPDIVSTCQAIAPMSEASSCADPCSKQRPLVQ